MRFSIIVPVLNEEECISATLDAIDSLTGDKEVIVVDGGSTDRTVEIALSHNVRLLHGARGRGPQLRSGAEDGCGEVLWFLHADTLPPPDALEHIARAIEKGASAGNFSLRFRGESRAARQLTFVYPLLRILGLCYGDSGIFVSKHVYEQAGGFREIPLFEDLDLLRRIRRAGRFVHLRCAVVTSSRRFQSRKLAFVWLRWIALQVFYWCGVSPHRLARWYSR